MRIFLCNSSSSSFSPPPTTTHHRLQKPLHSLPQKPSLIRSITTAAISFNLIFLSPLSPLPPPSIATEFSSKVVQSECREEDRRREDDKRLENAPELVTNEEIVKEAWEIVNESFLTTDGSRWSPQSWLQKKVDVMSTSLPTRSKAHDVIRRMLSSLGDPYTRFLSPAEKRKARASCMRGCFAFKHYHKVLGEAPASASDALFKTAF